MWVLTESGGLINLANYDQIPIVATEPEEIDGVANLGAKRAVFARKAAVDNEGEVRYLSTQLCGDLSDQGAVYVVTLIYNAMRKGSAVFNLQEVVKQFRAAANGQQREADGSKAGR